LLFMAVMITLNTIGLDLTAFTVFSGAIGVGIGFGLQKIVANFISGIILLLDRSVKPGDVIEVAGTYGVVRGLGARFAAVRTRDGTEHLIPNEAFITNSVINWTHSDKIIRRKAPIGISYGADVEKAMALIVDAANRVERVIHDPAPICLLNGFGDSSVNLEVRFWIGDPENGLANVTSQVLLEVWRSFQEHKVEIPFPQRDLHLRSSEPLHIKIDPEEAG
jgi:small-conductance mechanosensitive channel